MLAWTPCYPQGTADSLRLYCTPTWKMWRIARDLSTLDRQSILLDSSHQVIKLKNIALQSAELTIAAQDSAYQAKNNEAKECRLMDSAKDKDHKQELKTEKRKGNKKGLAGLAIGALLVLLL